MGEQGEGWPKTNMGCWKHLLPPLRRKGTKIEKTVNKSFWTSEKKSRRDHRIHWVRGGGQRKGLKHRLAGRMKSHMTSLRLKKNSYTDGGGSPVISVRVPRLWESSSQANPHSCGHSPVWRGGKRRLSNSEARVGKTIFGDTSEST